MKNRYNHINRNGIPNLFKSLSKVQKYLIGALILILVLISTYLWYRQSGNQNIPSKNVDRLNETSNQDTDNDSIGILNEKPQKISNSDYPSILARHQTNPKVGFNLALNQNESNAVYGFDRNNRVMKKLYDYLELPYQASNTNTRITNNFILQSFSLDLNNDQTFTQVSWTNFDNTKASNQKDYLGEIPLAYSSKSGGDMTKTIPENVVWFGLTNLSSVNLPTKDSDYGKSEFVDQGVYIYTRSLKNDVGTYLRDLKNGVEFKVSDQYCSNIFFSKSDFWCLNAQRKLVNLSTNTELGEYSKVATTDQGVLYATRNIEDQYSVIDEIKFNQANVPNISTLYQTKQGEIITHIAFTNQQELLIQVNQNIDMLESAQAGENLKELQTLELQGVGNSGSTITSIPRPEFDQFTVIF